MLTYVFIPVIIVCSIETQDCVGLRAEPAKTMQECEQVLQKMEQVIIDLQDDTIWGASSCIKEERIEI